MKTTNGSNHVSPMKGLLIDELADLLHAEHQLVEALPKMAAAAHQPKLKEAFLAHLKQTYGHVERLLSAFDSLKEKAVPKPCKAMLGLVAEGKETIDEGKAKPEAIADLGLITAAQKVEHYEISGYTSARSLAQQIGESKVATLLGETLSEEETADSSLGKLAGSIMKLAGHGEIGDHKTEKELQAQGA
jgi:Mn-containing catalase